MSVYLSVTPFLFNSNYLSLFLSRSLSYLLSLFFSSFIALSISSYLQLPLNLLSLSYSSSIWFSIFMSLFLLFISSLFLSFFLTILFHLFPCLYFFFLSHTLLLSLSLSSSSYSVYPTFSHSLTLASDKNEPGPSFEIAQSFQQRSFFPGGHLSHHQLSHILWTADNRSLNYFTAPRLFL